MTKIIRKLLAYTIIASMLLTLIPNAALSEETETSFGDNVVAEYGNNDNDHDHDHGSSQSAENGDSQPQASSGGGQPAEEPTEDFEEDSVVGFDEVTPENGGIDEMVTTTPSSGAEVDTLSNDAEVGTPSSDVEVGTPSSDAEVGTPSSDAEEITSSQSTGSIAPFDTGIVGTAGVPCSHNSYVCINVLISPTCTAIGRGAFQCSVCWDIQYFQEIPALGHAYDGIQTIAPTCANAGYTIFECSRCNDRRWGNLVPTSAASHEPKTTVARLEPTCTTAGHTANVVCTVCNFVLEESVTLPSPGHNWNAGIVNSPATCTTDGTKTYTCSACFKTETENLPRLSHAWSEWVETPATCVMDGVKTRTCQNDAAHVETVSIPTPGHNLEYVTIAPTCQSAGYTKVTCSRCGGSYEIDPVAMDSKYHVYETTITEIEATCTKAGRSAQVMCTICGNVREQSEAIPVTAHQWDAGILDPKPTCTASGTRIYTCGVCKKIETENVAKLEHEWSQWVETSATCVIDGQKIRTCQNDTSHVETQLLPAPGHDYLYNIIPATCQTAGRTILTCSKCNDRTWRDLVPASVADHKRRITIPAVAPTCTKDGRTDGAVCDICNVVLETSEVIPSPGHVWNLTAGNPAACETDGLKTYTCSGCFKSWTEDVPKLGHDWGKWEVTPAACETEGLRSRACKNDPTHVDWETIPALGHDLQYVPIAPNCQTAGYTKVTCVRCGGSYDIDPVAVNPDNHVPEVSIPAVAATCIVGGWTAEIKCALCGKVLEEARATSILGPHQWDEGIITLAPSCTTDGIRTYTCEVCKKEKKTVNEPTQGHKPDLTRPVAGAPSVEPTCTADGKGSFYCSVCLEIVTGVTTPALGHDWGEWKVVTPATCVADGQRTRACKNDPTHVEREAIKKTGHAWDKWEVTPPTCLRAGERTRKCKNDPTHVEKETIPALGHNWGAWEGTPPTCEKVGPETRTCKNDPSHVEVRFIAMTGHNWGAWVVTPPTCLNAGQKTRTCKNDPAHVERQTIAKTGHNFLSDPRPRVTAPTCVKQGYTTYACQNAQCHAVYAGRYTPATGAHRYKLITMKKATKMNAGYKRYACQNDGCTSEYTEILSKLGSASSTPHTPGTSGTSGTSSTSNASAANINTNTVEHDVPLSGYNTSLGLLSDLMLDMLNQLLGNSAFTPEILQALLQNNRIRALPLDMSELTEEGIRLPILSDGDVYLAGYMLIKPAEKDGQRGFTWTVEPADGFTLSGVKILAAQSIEKLVMLAESAGATTFYEDGDFVPASGLMFIALWCNATHGVSEPSLYQRDQTVESLLNELIGDLAK